MRIWIAIGMLMATTVAAYAAAEVAVPEIDAFSGLAAMGLIGSIGALIWERRGLTMRIWISIGFHGDNSSRLR